MSYPEYCVGEVLHEGSDLKIVDAEAPTALSGSPAKPINRGGSGIVFKAIQADTIPRAIKILLPKQEFLEARGWSDFVSEFDNEKRKLAAVTHSNLAKLISFGRIPIKSDGGEDPPFAPYIVMEFVEGRPLHRYIIDIAKNEPLRDRGAILGLFGDVLSALQYLHQKDAVHCDVKEDNILVRTTHRPEAVLVDLGAAHVLADPRPETTSFYTTPSRVSPEWQARIGTAVPTSLLHENRTALDLYMFGSMLKVFLDKDLLRRKVPEAWQPQVLDSLRAHVGENGIVVIERISEKCLQGLYASADDVRQDLTAIGPHFVSPLGIPELSMGTDTKTLLALPHSSVPLTGRINAVLNHPSVQRLRQIPQLDFVKLIYVGATHSRLLHSLETYNLTRRYVGHLLGDPVFRAYCAERHKLEAVLLAGLLHDIGHYPLEHVFEDFALRMERNGPFAEILRDEDVAAAVLGLPRAESKFVPNAVASYLDECRTVLRNPLVIALPDLINELFGDRVLSYLRRILDYGNEPDDGVVILRSILSGPLDVDKVAYLNADSEFSGAAYGRAIDVETLLGSLTCRAGATAGIAIREKGLCAAESIATSRRWMFQRVYWHRTNRAIMAMLRYAPQFMFGNNLLSFPDYFNTAYRISDIEAIKWIDARFSTAVGGDKGENPAKMIVDGRRGIYKAILEFSPTDLREDVSLIRSYLMRSSSIEWLEKGAEIAEIARTFAPQVMPSDVLLDIPAPRRHRIGDTIVALESGSDRMLSEVSDEFRQTQAFFEKGAMSCRVFVHPNLRKTLLDTGSIDAFRHSVVDFLRNRAGR